tara:strand:+ start:2853 stop:3578 length:726 start_codon:yes stop_codon:yes gene_type:complete
MQASKAKYAKLFVIANLLVFGAILLWQAYSLKDKEEYIRNQDYVINILEDSVEVYESDLFFAIDLLESFEQEVDSVEHLLVVERNKKRKVITVVEKDTVKVTPDGRNILANYDLLFNEVVRFNGGAFRIEGISSFKWDYINNEPYDEKLSIEDFKVNINLTTRLKERPDGYEIEVLPMAPFVDITGINNNLLTGQEFIKKVPSRVSFGIHAGYGLTSDGFTPFVGVGITYNFIDLTEILKD